MTCSIRLTGVSKTFTRPRRRARSSLLAALRAGSQDNDHDSIRALSEISLAITEGERVGIIGANGAGKSTLLHLLAGVAEPTSGTVEVAGRVHAVLTLGAVLREETTGRENIYLDGEMQGRTHAEIDALVDEMVAFAELGEFIDRPVRTYSSGMKARLGFAMIAFLDPEILLVDEALSVGDVHFARKATQRMRELTARGRIVILVSHGMQAIVEMCTRCIWLEDGRVVMDGHPRAVTETYLARVHDTDREALRRKFGDSAHPPGHDGARIHWLDAVQDARTAATVAPGRDFALRVSGDARALARPGLTLRLLRIDGTIVAEQAMDADDGPRLQGPFHVDIAMRPLVLGPSVYRADVLLTNNTHPVAGASIVFEVRTTDALIGGVPMLFYPPRVTVTRIAEAGVGT